MFCSYCGKQKDYEGKLCKECEAALKTETPPFYGENEYYPPVFDRYFYSTEPEPHNRMFGFGKALASVVMSTIGTVFIGLALMFSLFSGGVGLFFLLMVFGLSIPALVFGIRSIRCFVRRKATCAKNIPTLVLGIYGVYQAVGTLSGTFVVLLISLANL